MVKPPMEAVTAFTQLRTDTTLDLSQKAEKVCLNYHPQPITNLWLFEARGLILFYNLINYF